MNTTGSQNCLIYFIRTNRGQIATRFRSAHFLRYSQSSPVYYRLQISTLHDSVHQGSLQSLSHFHRTCNGVGSRDKMASKHQESTQNDVHLGSTEPISGHIKSPLTSESARMNSQHSSVLHDQQIQSPLSAKPHPQHLTRQHLQQSMRRWQRLFTIRIVSLFLAVFGACFYCWDHPNEIINLKNRISKIFSEVGTETLSQKELQTQATAYSKQMIKDVFNDEGMRPR